MNKILATEELNIQPPASIYGTFSRYSYKTWYAIAEFVDNSTASFYKNQRTLKFYKQDKLKIDIEYNPDDNYLRITDNAYGMELADFKRAILLNSRPETNDGRNEFGMGLKTAASWFGKSWSVTSTQFGSKNRYSATVDIPYLEKSKKNTIDIVTTRADQNDHGTIVEIRHLTKRIEGGRTIAKIKDVLRSMYRRDLDTGKVTITYNHNTLTFNKYHILTAKGKEWRKNLDFYFDFAGIKHHITGFVGILGEGSAHDSGSYDKAGFALFRRDRVIIGSEGEYYKPEPIFGQAQSRISLNMFGELNLEDFDINQAKDGFVWDNGLEEAFIEALSNQIQDYIKFADLPKPSRSDNFNANDKRELEKTKKVIQNSLNNLNSVDDTQTIDLGNCKSEEEKEFINTFVNINVNEKVYKDSTIEYALPGSEEKIKVTWSNAGGSYWFDMNKDSNEIKINISHPFFKPYNSSPDFKNVLNKFVIAIYLAEKAALDDSNVKGYILPDDLNNEINELLKKLGK